MARASYLFPRWTAAGSEEESCLLLEITSYQIHLPESLYLPLYALAVPLPWCWRSHACETSESVYLLLQLPYLISERIQEAHLTPQALPQLAVPCTDVQVTVPAKLDQNLHGSLGNQWPCLDRACRSTGRVGALVLRCLPAILWVLLTASSPPSSGTPEKCPAPPLPASLRKLSVKKESVWGNSPANSHLPVLCHSLVLLSFGKPSLSA